MTIREYIDTIDEVERDEIAETLYACYEADFDDFCAWAIENGIDTETTVIEGGHEFTVLSLWALDLR